VHLPAHCGDHCASVILRRLLAVRAAHRWHKLALDANHARRYYSTVILSFKCEETEALAIGQPVKRFVSIEATARRKLRQLQIANRLEDLRVPPGNRLEALKGNRAGQYSIRINDQFRICFRWTTAGAEDVEIVDYH
jgi:proteic killer suppression protein